MPEELTPDDRAAGVGSKETIRPGEFSSTTLSAGEEITVWTEEVNQDQLLYHGYGVLSRRFARGFVGLDVRSAADTNVTGDLHIAVEDSEGNTLAVTTFDDLDELRDSLNESRSDRIVEPAHTANGDLAGPGRRLAIYLEADDDSDGDEVNPAASSGKMYYGKVQR